MKKFVKGITVLSLLSAGFCLFAQETENISGDEEIQLPDVSTVIYGGSIKAGKSAIPDYTEVLPQNAEANGDFAVQLPSDGADSGSSEKAEILPRFDKKTIFVEGTAGCGVPGFFLGNFSVYRQTGNPFRIYFGHESASGYAYKSLNDGYFDRLTQIAAEKDFTWKAVKLDLSGSYKNSGDGLQDKSDVIADVSKETLSGDVSLFADLSHGLFIKTGLKGEWYKRYGNLTGDSAAKDAVPTALKQVSILGLNPQFTFGWENKGFSADFNMNYQLESDLYGSFDETKNLHRGTFGLGLGWHNANVNVYGNAAVVLGNELNGNDVTVPFKAGADFMFVTGLSPRNMIIGFSGGCDSRAPLVSGSESLYKFSAASELLTETSDWTGNFALSLPVKNAFTFIFDAEFRKTAFDNGTWLPCYSEEASVINSNFYGQYIFEQNDMTQFNTDAGISFRFGIVTLSALWNACWGDVPALRYKNFISAQVSLQTKNSRFGFDGNFGLTPDSDEDNVPVIDFSFFFRVTNAVRLAVSCDDIVKLLGGKTRTYAGQYVRRSGNAAFLVKFNF